MQFVLLVGFAAVLIWLLARAGFGVSDRAVAVLARGFFGWYRSLPLGRDAWPIGVQEEDRDRPWGSRDPRDPRAPWSSPPEPPLSRVESVVRLR